MHRAVIMRAVERGDSKLAEWKIGELVKLAKIFEGLDPSYQLTLEEIIAQIR